MKKGIIKKALIAASVLPCMLFATACGNTSLSAEQKNDSYKTLRDLAISRNFIDANSQAGVYTSNSEQSITYNFSKSGLNETQIETVKNEQYMKDFEAKDGEEYKYGFKADGTGYYVEKEYDEKTEQLVLEGQEFAKKTGEDYIAYNLEKLHGGGIVRDVKIAKRVDEHYGKGYYSQTLTQEVLNNTIDIFKQMQKHSNFNGFVNSYASYISEEAGEEVNAKFDIKKSGGEYVLTAKIYVEDYSSSDDPNTKMDLNSSFKIVYDNDSINEIVSENNVQLNSSSKCADVITCIDGVTFTDSNIITATVETDMTVKYDLNTEFDATILDESTDGYIGMGLNGEIKNHDVHMSIFEPITNKLIGFKSGYMGDALDLSNISYPLLHTHIEGFYYDRTFTEAVGENPTMPSYFRDIYAKVVADDGYAVLTFKVFADIEGEIIEDSFYESYNEAGNYKYEPEDGFEIKEIVINGVLAENAIADGFNYELNNVYHVDIYVTQIAE